jgi:hypothetical protein
MKDGGVLTLTVPVDGEAVDRALVRLLLCIVPILTDDRLSSMPESCQREKATRTGNDDHDGDDGTPDGRTTTTTTDATVETDT